jgi:uncharacterized lipoprotein YehR (DUF1307 family)
LKKTVIVLFLALILAVSLVGCGGGRGTGGGGSNVNKYAGNWQGTWAIQNSGEHGTVSITISNSGLMTGTITNSLSLVGSTEISGQLTGNNVTFSYKFSGLPQLFVTGTFGAITGNQVQVSFTIDNSAAHGTFSLTK